MQEDSSRDRLTTTDALGKRIYLYPASVKGRFRSRKIFIHAAMLSIFLVLPWLRVNGRQWVQLDIAQREFFLFGAHFRAHDAPMILFLVLGFLFAIGFISAVWGRLWCGWACPQTVFIEFLFRPIENWIEGSHRERKALDAAPWDSVKIQKKTLKWLAFIILSLAIAHSFLGFFVGTHELLAMTLSSPTENWSTFLLTLSVTGILLFDFGWFREQFCTIVCPYGRFQSVLLDSDSLVVAYNTKREDCVSCNRCVQVCPTGIDIRNGLQMECIACTACIDACNEVMRKIKKPEGLIKYTTQRKLSGEKTPFLRARPLAYLGLFFVCALTLILSLAKKDFLEVTVLRAGDAPYQVIQKATETVVINHFRLDLSNQTDKHAEILVTVADAQNVKLILPTNPIILEKNDNRRTDFFLEFSPTILENGARKISLHLTHDGQEQIKEVPLVGPDA